MLVQGPAYGPTKFHDAGVLKLLLSNMQQMGHTSGKQKYLSITTSLWDFKQVLQEVALLFLEQFFAGGVHVCSDGLVCIEGPNVHLANLKQTRYFDMRIGNSNIHFASLKATHHCSTHSSVLHFSSALAATDGILKHTARLGEHGSCS